jgi:hypothetical protein
MKAIADHGARFVGCNVMFLEGGTRDHFIRWLAREFPHLVEGYDGLYAGKYAPAAYRKEVHNVVGLLRKKYSVNGRDGGRDDDVGQKSKGKGQREPESEEPAQTRLDL